MTVSLILVALVSLPFIAILVRRPVLRRLALRNAVRRPREAALVVLGSLLGAAIITGSAVVGDTMDASIRQVARTHLGPIDELVTTRNAAEQAQLLRVLRPLESGSIDRVLGFATIDAAVTSTGSGRTGRRAPTLVGVDSLGREPSAATQRRRGSLAPRRGWVMPRSAPTLLAFSASVPEGGSPCTHTATGEH